MQYTAITLLALAAVANAQSCTQSSQTKTLLSSISTLKSAVEKVDGEVKSFEQSQGITGAMSIQTDEGPIADALTQVTSDTNAIDLSSLQDCEAQAIAQAIGDVSSSVVSLLSDLTSKASDLIAVGTQQIVANDLKQLVGGTYSLESAAYSKIPCQYGAQASSAFAGINAGFSSCAAAYSYTIGSSAPAATCVSTTLSGGSGSGSAAATSAAATSAAASAPASSAAAVTSGAASAAASSAAASAPASAAASGSAAASAPAQASGSAAASSGIAQSNGASMVGVSAVAALVGGAALLL